MTFLETHYLPTDRFHSLAAGLDLPLMVDGSALFADISGFTPVTERLRMILGARRGAEELAAHLNRVYEVLIAQVDRYGGSIIGFAGDAITCWFGTETAAVQATVCGFALLDAMRGVEQITLPDGSLFRLGLKAVVTSGTTRRFVVGDPGIQLIDALAGATVARVAVGEALAERGELLADVATLERLGNAGVVRDWRGGGTDRFAVLEPFEQSPDLAAVRFDSSLPIQRETLFPWMLPALVHHIRTGMGEFPIELRPVTALFLRFSGINYDDDTNAAEKLNQLARQVQAIVHGYEGSVLQLTIGDKGSYLYAAFGAPFAHEDDAVRALNAAIGIREVVGRLGYLDPAQIGISRGIMRTGAYGSSTRRTYGVLGDEVNLAARLMSQTEPGTILLSESLLGVNLDGFALESLTPIEVKGKANPIRVFRLTGLRERSFEARFYTSPMVGRGDELTKLHAAVRPVFEGRHSGVTLVYGEPGMGKSRLAFELQQRLQQDGASVTWLTGQADALNRAPFSAFAYFLRHYFGQQRDRNRDNNINMAAFEIAFDDLLAFADETTRADLVLYRS
ncbi:MAG TPA: adenylate/guanylate cyclase domain-containing protein, partial [Phototrophicaceae bacterium]|nr:adenylate/guanylate cyclase domain-containing protein [Phototrophicaceae bacterium]